MSLSSAKAGYAMQLLLNGKSPAPEAAVPFTLAFTAYFKNASLDGTPIAPGTESLPHAAGALLSGVSIAFKTSTEIHMTSLLLQASFQSYWSAKDPVTDEVAIKTMWPDCTAPVVIEKPFADFFVKALSKQEPTTFEAATAIAGAICDWLTTSVKVDVGGDFFYFD